MINHPLIRFFLIPFIISQIIFFGSIDTNCFATSETAPYEVMPWRVGQYVLYQIISMEGEDADNRYKISLIGKEKVNGKEYFWVKIDIWESVLYYGYDTITKELKKNISFKVLVPPLDALAFLNDPSSIISTGIFPRKAIRLAVQINEGEWHWVDPKDFFNHQGVIEDTPYSFTPHAKGRIDFNKLKIDNEPQAINSAAGKLPCYHFSVDTGVEEEYWDEGMDLWRSPDVPILGLVKMEFSKTKYWQKWAYRNELQPEKTLLGFLKYLYKKRVSGRRRPDTCTILLIDYGAK